LAVVNEWTARRGHRRDHARGRAATAHPGRASAVRTGTPPRARPGRPGASQA
jgi:hypothetical protein